MKMGASNRTVRSCSPVCRSHNIAFQSNEALRMYRSLADQLSDCTWRMWPRSLRATP
jgi:hypothetical protein